MFTFHHICLSVKNIENSIAFYKNFDFSVVFRKIFENQLEIAHLKLYDTILELFCFSNPINSSSAISYEEDLKKTGIKHFALKVSSLQKAKEKLISLGIIDHNIQIKNGRTGIQYFFIQDPDDNFIEVVQDDRGY